jgi:hypothetical protein
MAVTVGRISAGVLLLAAALLAGCGGPAGTPVATVATSAPTSAGSEGGICYAVSDAEITSLMGKQPIGNGAGSELSGIKTCSWVLGPNASVSITLSGSQQFDENRLPIDEPIRGLGDDAYWQENRGTLTVKMGSHSVSVTVWSPTQDTKAVATEVARLALSRLA